MKACYAGMDKNEIKAEKRYRRARVFGIISAIWAVVIFCVYALVDYWNVMQDGWTSANIVITVFLLLQLVVGVLFPLLSASGKMGKKHGKNVKKGLKISKKIILNLITLATTIMLVMAVEKGKVDYKSIIQLVATILALVMIAVQIAFIIVMEIIKRKAAVKFAEAKANMSTDIIKEKAGAKVAEIGDKVKEKKVKLTDMAGKAKGRISAIAGGQKADDTLAIEGEETVADSTDDSSAES